MDRSATSRDESSAISPMNERDLAHVVNDDHGVITERGPDTVRGPDFAFYC